MTFCEQNENLTAADGVSFRFGVDDSGKYGYIVTGEEGADTVIPFGVEPKLVGTYSGNRTIDCTGISDYEHLTADDFFIALKSVSASYNITATQRPVTSASVSAALSKTYNSGELTVSGATTSITRSETSSNGDVRYITVSITAQYNVYVI